MSGLPGSNMDRGAFHFNVAHAGGMMRNSHACIRYKSHIVEFFFNITASSKMIVDIVSASCGSFPTREKSTTSKRKQSVPPQKYMIKNQISEHIIFHCHVLNGVGRRLDVFITTSQYKVPQQIDPTSSPSPAQTM